QIGCIAIPVDVLEAAARGDDLTADQERMMERHPAIARELLEKIPRLEPVAEMIGFQNASGDRKTPLGSRILTVALDFDDRISRGAGRRQALEAMTAQDPKLVKLLADVELPGQSFVLRTLSIKELMMGMILEEDVRNENGSLVVAREHEITRSMLERLRNYAELGRISDSIRVRVPGTKTEAGSSDHAPRSAGS
ncbi:MAG: HD domain-containing phosphohydrolase, partial [Planctomycetota bacterium]